MVHHCQVIKFCEVPLIASGILLCVYIFDRITIRSRWKFVTEHTQWCNMQFYPPMLVLQLFTHSLLSLRHTCGGSEARSNFHLEIEINEWKEESETAILVTWYDDYISTRITWRRLILLQCCNIAKSARDSISK